MGFEAPETVFKLTFEDPQYAELEVRVRAATVGGALRIGHLPADVRELAGMEKLDLVLNMFAEHLADWNVTKKGEPVPATRAGIDALEGGFLAVILGAWFRLMFGVPGPLGNSSSDGEQSLEGLERMESLSEPLPSTPEHDSSSSSVSASAVSPVS